jgi:hypothetical protein
MKNSKFSRLFLIFHNKCLLHNDKLNIEQLSFMFFYESLKTS